MSRFIRISLWTIGVLAVLSGATGLWVESQLRPEPLGARVKGLLADAKIKGGIARVEASLDGSFSAEGINLTLEDGTQFAAATIKGEARLWSIIRGTYALSSLEVKGLDLDLSTRSTTRKPASYAPSLAPTKTRLPPFALGPYAASGRVKLEDGTLLRFSCRGEVFDSNGKADFRAGIAWPGFMVGTQQTDPRGEIVLKANFRRPLGGDGLSPDELTADIGNVQLELTAKDASPIAAGAISLSFDASPAAAKDGLGFHGLIKDSANRGAVQFTGTFAHGRTQVDTQLDVDPTRFGILSRELPDIHLNGRTSAELDGANWKVSTDLKASWTDLSKFSKSLRKNSASEWIIKADAAGSNTARALNHLAITGNGISISMPQPLTWKGGLLPNDSSGAALTIVANDAELVALTPFLAMAGLTATTGRWTGEAAVSFAAGQATVANIRTHSFKGLTIEQAGKILVRNIDAEVPLKSDAGAITVGPFKVTCAAGDIASGSLTLRPGADGAWSALANVNVGIVELASQPNWEELPVEKLKGIRINAQVSVDRTAGKSPSVTSAEAGILRQGLNLLSLKLRKPIALDGSKPVGVVVEASARDLPLESLAAVVPGLKLSGDLKRADLVAGFKSEGLFIRTEGAPLAFIGTSVTWQNKLWVKECDLAASLDLLIGDHKNITVGFNKAELTSHGRTLAAGDISLGLNASGLGATTLKLRGDLGELAGQPFAGPLNIISGGQYSATADYSPSGEIAVTVNVVDVGLRQSDGRVKEAQVRGKYAPTPNGLTAEGSFLMKANNVSSGKFTLTKTSLGQRTDWQGGVAIDNVDVDDFLALMPKSAEAAEEAKPAAVAKPDKKPFWENQTGSLQLSIGSANAYGVVAQKVLLKAEADEKAVRLTQLTGTVAEGSLSGRGQLTFLPTISNGPYSLSATINLKQLEVGAIAQAVPSIKEFLQGKADVAASLTSVCGTPAELVSKLQVDTELNSKGGRIRAFGNKDSGASLAANKAGDIGQLLGLGAMLIGGANNNPKMAKIGAAVSAAAKLQKALADFNYDAITIKASRLASGTIKLDQADIRNASLHLSAKGGINIDPKAPFSDWPMVIDTQMRGAGDFASLFNALGYGSAPSKSDGLTDGPGVKVTGSLNNIKSDLAAQLQQAIDRISSSSAQAAPSTQPDATQPQPPATKKRNPLGDLLKQLGK